MSSSVFPSETATSATEPFLSRNLYPSAAVAELTVIIHGNGASDEPWWRPGTADSLTFADRLERALAERSKPNTVWKPALAQGVHCDKFAWSGQNSHKDRLYAARRLGSILSVVAHKLGATFERPLRVNFVGHSHGGNVCLEAMKYLGKEVRVRSVVLMGTPLVTATPSFRPARFILAPPLLTFIMAALMASIPLVIAALLCFLQEIPAILSLRWTGVAANSKLGKLLVWVVLVASSPVIYGMLFRFLCWAADCAWRFFCLIWLKLSARRHLGESWRAYGPSDVILFELLEGGSILSLSTANDEADVLLQSVVAPMRVYNELARHMRGIGWWLGILFRAVDLFLPCVECICESYALGLSRFKALFFDHEIVNAATYDYYPRSIFVHEAVIIKDAQVSTTLGNSQTRTVSLDTISDRIVSVFKEVSSRVPLWHSTYHQSDQIVERVADHIVGAEPAEVRYAMTTAA